MGVKEGIKMKQMTGLKEVAKASKKIRQEDPSTWVIVYFSFKDNRAYTTGGEDRFYVTKLIRENTPNEVEQAIRRWMAL